MAALPPAGVEKCYARGHLACLMSTVGVTCCAYRCGGAGANDLQACIAVSQVF